jgi:2,4-dienoyl-CoA reductase-like NADH-dependent reductase (Old Yellow Enzyme family)
MTTGAAPSLFDTVTFPRGPAMPNRFMLAPLTNCQSHPDGTCSRAEHDWLTMRATGGFGATMTAAAHVQPVGQGFPGQIGIFSDDHLPGLGRLADAVRAAGSVSLVQLHHAGHRAPADLVGTTPVCPSDDPETGARAMTGAEVEGAIEAFVDAAVRAERAGFDGIELHGAHSYLICEFLNPDLNRRDDRYGGSLEGRARFLIDILRGVRERCGADFVVGVRLSPERFGMRLAEIVDVASELLGGDLIDFLDMSLWDCAKMPLEANDDGRTLLEHFTDIPRGGVRLGVAGKLRAPADARRVIEAGCDFALLGRVAIVHHDYPRLVAADPDFLPVPTPVAREHLAAEGVSPVFVDYLARSFPRFVAEEEPMAAG